MKYIFFPCENCGGKAYKPVYERNRGYCPSCEAKRQSQEQFGIPHRTGMVFLSEEEEVIYNVRNFARHYNMGVINDFEFSHKIFEFVTRFPQYVEATIECLDIDHHVSIQTFLSGDSKVETIHSVAQTHVFGDNRDCLDRKVKEITPLLDLVAELTAPA